MPTHQKLVEMIRARKSSGEFATGIVTADQLVEKAIDELGTGCIQRYSKMMAFDRSEAIKRAASALTYADDKMRIEQTASPGSFKDMVPSGVEVPKHTLMIVHNVLTSTRKDRDGDTLSSDGAKVDPNGAFLWQHMFNVPIGKHIAVSDQNDMVVKEINALLDLNELTEDAAKLIEAKALRFSHGFQALDWEEIKNGKPDGSGPAFNVKVFEVMERSLVSVPANPDAVIELYSRGRLASEPMKSWAKSLDSVRQKSVPGVTLDKKSVLDAVKYGSSSSEFTGSLEWVKAKLIEQLRSQYKVAESDVPSNDKMPMNPYIVIVATFDDRVIFAVHGVDIDDDPKCYRQSWSLVDGIPQLTGEKERVEIAVEPRAYIQARKAFDVAVKSAIESIEVAGADKAGRVLSRINASALEDVLGDLNELADIEGLPRSATALVDRCKGKIKKLMESAQPKNEQADGEKAMTLQKFIAEAGDSELRRVRDVLEVRIKQLDDQKIVEMIRATT